MKTYAFPRQSAIENNSDKESARGKQSGGEQSLAARIAGHCAGQNGAARPAVTPYLGRAQQVCAPTANKFAIVTRAGLTGAL